MENTVFFGNGINRLSDNNISWSHILDLIKGLKKFNDSDLPNTMIYERIIMEKPILAEDPIYDEFEVKKQIAGLMGSVENSTFYSHLYNMNFQHYVTTNYDYAYLNSIVDLEEVNLPVGESSTEDIYSLRRTKSISNTNEKNKNFWQIHGEIKKPATIMLGLDHYCGSVGKIDSYIKGWYRYEKEGEKIIEESIENKFINNSFTNSSWVELFFTSNIHIIDFSLDYSEIDLWWILNKRARMKRSKSLNHSIKNKITYHTHCIDEQKKGLFESLDVEVCILPLPNDLETKYIDYNTLLFQSLENKIQID